MLSRYQEGQTLKIANPNSNPVAVIIYVAIKIYGILLS